MYHELNGLGAGNTDLQHLSRSVGTDEHREVVQVIYADWIAIGVQDVFVGDSMFPGLARITGSIASIYLDGMTSGGPRARHNRSS